jgi:hypothetical protein
MSPFYEKHDYNKNSKKWIFKIETYWNCVRKEMFRLGVTIFLFCCLKKKYRKPLLIQFIDRLIDLDQGFSDVAIYLNMIPDLDQISMKIMDKRFKFFICFWGFDSVGPGFQILLEIVVILLQNGG